MAWIFTGQRVLSGLLAGGFLLATLGLRPAVESLAGPAHIRIRQALIPRFRALLLPLMLATVALAGLGVWVRRWDVPLVQWVGLVCAVAMPVLTVAVNVPVNHQALAWTPESPPEYWRKEVALWNIGDTIRLVLSLAAFLCAEVS